jgi:hypothetical protein
VVSDQRRKCAFASVALVLLGITVFLTLRDPGSGSRQDSRAQPPTGTTRIATGPPPAFGAGEPDGSRNTTQPSAPAPSTSSAPASATRGEREPENAPAIAPQDARAATAATRAFLDGYLPYSYGRADAKRIRVAALSLVRELKASPPRVPATIAQARPRRISARAQAATGDLGVHVRAVIDDGQRRYRIPLSVRKAGRRWVVTAVSG